MISLNRFPEHSSSKPLSSGALGIDSRKAFSLLEVMVAAVIVAIGILPVFDMISQANQTLSSVEEETVGFALASEMGEWIKSQGYSNLRYPLKGLHIVPSEWIVEKNNHFEIVEEPIRTFEVGKGEKTKVDYDPAKDFQNYSRNTLIFKDEENNGIKVRVIVSWRSKLDKSGQKDKSKVMLELLRFPD